MTPSEDTAERAPVWLITYSDLMTLLLVFFVLLFSISEFRQSERFQGVARSLHSKFGPAAKAADEQQAVDALLAGNLRAAHERRRALLQSR